MTKALHTENLCAGETLNIYVALAGAKETEKYRCRVR